MRDLREIETLLANLDRDSHELEGLLRGMALDGKILPEEVAALRDWCAKRRDVSNVGPFAELIPRIEHALEDGVIDEAERADILWFCDRLRTPSVYYSVASSDMQRLHGLLAGIGADGVVDESELLGLRAWMESARSLRGSWPYDEVETLIRDVLRDGRIDEEEQRFLVAFTREFLRSSTNLVLEDRLDEDLVRFGVCAATPEIVFEKRTFCFTGSSPAASRSELEAIVGRLGGTAVPEVTSGLDYLVVAEERGRSWAFSCYGRKVETAVALRKQGARLAIVHEADFWNAAAAFGETPPPTTM